MTNLSKLVLSICIVSVLLFGPAAAASGQVLLRGRVTDVIGSPVRGVTIQFAAVPVRSARNARDSSQDQSPDVIAPVLSGEDGSFGIWLPELGNYGVCTSNAPALLLDLCSDGRMMTPTQITGSDRPLMLTLQAGVPLHLTLLDPALRLQTSECEVSFSSEGLLGGVKVLKRTIGPDRMDIDVVVPANSSGTLIVKSSLKVIDELGNTLPNGVPSKNWTSRDQNIVLNVQ